MTWKILGASVPGVTHLQAGRGCDDAHGWLVDGNLAVGVVADGAGSRVGTSMFGSHAACSAVLEMARDPSFVVHARADPESAVRHLFDAALNAVQSKAKELDLEVGKLATTLCVLVATELGVTIGQIGDGIAVVGPNPIRAVAVGEKFEYANETVFLTSERALEDHLALFSQPGDEVAAVALTTDGLRYKVLDNVLLTVPFDGFYTSTWVYARRENATSESIRDWLETVDDQTGDDKTLLVALRDFEGTHVDVGLSQQPGVTGSHPTNGDERFEPGPAGPERVTQPAQDGALTPS